MIRIRDSGIVIWAVCAVMAASGPVRANSDDAGGGLFSMMEGRWAGEGSRRYSVSGREIRIIAETNSRITENGKVLLSRNRFIETDERGSRDYTRDYWIRRAPARDTLAPKREAFDLGSGSLEDGRVTARGFFYTDETGIPVFEVEQTVPTQPVIRILSRTRFLDSARSAYRDTGWIGERMNVQSEVIYVRADQR